MTNNTHEAHNPPISLHVRDSEIPRFGFVRDPFQKVI